MYSVLIRAVYKLKNPVTIPQKKEHLEIPIKSKKTHILFFIFLGSIYNDG